MGLRGRVAETSRPGRLATDDRRRGRSGHPPLLDPPSAHRRPTASAVVGTLVLMSISLVAASTRTAPHHRAPPNADFVRARWWPPPRRPPTCSGEIIPHWGRGLGPRADGDPAMAAGAYLVESRTVTGRAAVARARGSGPRRSPQ